MTVLWLAACNHAPSDFRDGAIAPNGNAPWGYPTDVACDEREDPDAVVIDGFTFCGREQAGGKVAVDDPVYRPCDQLPDDVSGTVFSVFDGVRARAWSIEKLDDRELVNDDWDGEPLLVDY